ncbi:MAG: hypothetical protein WCI52_02555 [bacterium]
MIKLFFRGYYRFLLVSIFLLRLLVILAELVFELIDSIILFFFFASEYLLDDFGMFLLSIVRQGQKSEK